VPSTFLSASGPTLARVLDWTWSALDRGARDRRHPFRTGILASAGPGGASARTVVLRASERAARTVRFHTDRRSPKVGQLTTGQRVEWVFWHPRHKVQVRVRGRPRLHFDDAVAERHWAAASESAKACYRQASGPGGLWSTRPSPTRPPRTSGPGRERFCVVSVEVERIDWLHLRAAGHLRAGFEWSEDGELSLQAWIFP
jgi:hypothetical protein